MCTAGKVSEAYTFGDQMALDLTQWREVLGAAAKHDAACVPLILDKIRPHGLNAKDYSKVFRSLRDTMPDDAKMQLEAYLTEMREAGIEITVQEQQASLARLHIALGELDAAMAILGSWDMDNARSLMMWNTRLEYQVAVEDVAAVKASIKRMRERDMTASQVALSFLVRQEIEAKIAHTPELRWTDVVACITKVEKESETRAQDWVWAEVINLIVDRTGDVELVLQVYEEARSLGIAASSRVVRAVLVPLLKSQPVRLGKAMDVYADFTSQPIAMNDHHSRTRATAIYAMLLAACTGTVPIDPSIPLRLLQDMRANDVHLSPKLFSDLLVALIKSAPDHDTAFNYYAHAYVAAPGAFDAEAYSELAMAFLTLSTEESPFPPPNYVFEMIRDMRTAGYLLSNHTLARLLKTYGLRATPSRKWSADPIFRQRKIDKIHRAISDVHALINMGSLVIPDVPLLAALMDAYSRVGAYTSAFQVWDQLLERRQREEPSRVPELYGPAVGTILDTCGRADQYTRGVKIINWAKRFKIASPKVMESWVECLCRLKRYDEAVQVVCVQMRDQRPEDVKEAARILLKFSWKDKLAYAMVPDQVKEAWPGIWDEVKAVVETKTAPREGVHEASDI
jgi:tetratricopeptide (TPR) repeat protein